MALEMLALALGI